MKRFVFDNLIYKLGDDRYILLNLISFRRKIVNKKTLEMLEETEEKLSQHLELSIDEKNCYEGLIKSKQILGAPVEEQVYGILSSKSRLKLDRIPVRALTFNLTHKCNFNCTYCYQNKYKSRPAYQGHITIEAVKEIAEFIRMPEFDSSAIDEVVISGGEPLLEENVATINYICDSIPAKKISLFTNGVNILKFKPQCDFTKIDEFQISLDGTDPVIKQVNRYPGNIHSILQGIDYLLQLGKKVSLVTMWTRELEEHLSEYIELIKTTNFLDDSNFKMKIIVAKDFYYCNNLDESIYSLEYIRDCRRKYNRQLHRELKCSIELFTEAGLLASLLHRPLNEVIEPRYRRCNISNTIPMVFEPNGEVYWCLCLGNSTGLIGNYLSKAVDVKKIHDFGNRTIFSIEKCKSCKFKYVCGGGCVLGLTGRDSDLYEPVCSIFDNAYFWDHLEELI